MLQKALLIFAAAFAAWSFRHAPEAWARDMSAPVDKSYLCFDASSAAEVMKKANEAASRGWRLSLSGVGNEGGIWCLERDELSPLRDR